VKPGRRIRSRGVSRLGHDFPFSLLVGPGAVDRQTVGRVVPLLYRESRIEISSFYFQKSREIGVSHWRAMEYIFGENASFLDA
jgi:hypothetical protein